MISISCEGSIDRIRDPGWTDVPSPTIGLRSIEKHKFEGRFYFGTHNNMSLRAWSRARAWRHVRAFSSPSGDESMYDGPSARVSQLADEIAGLTLLEASDLSELLKKKLKLSDAPPMMGFGAQMMAGMPQMAGGASGGSAVEEAKEEKSAFDVRLDSFDAANKIKIIKEVRAVTELGLKEAKELVEKAPTVVKAGMPKEEAEALKKKLEELGGKITLE